MRVDLTPFARAGRSEVLVEGAVTVPPGPVAGLGRDAALDEAVPVAVLLRGAEGRVRIHVSGGLTLRCPCDRCLEPVAVPVAVDYSEEWRLRRQPPRANVGDPDDLVDLDEEVVVRHDAGDAFADLGDGFWQNVALALPVKVLCGSACLGLCPRCGTNRNRQRCACRQADADPRLAVLAEWRPSKR